GIEAGDLAHELGADGTAGARDQDAFPVDEPGHFDRVDPDFRPTEKIGQVDRLRFDDPAFRYLVTRREVGQQADRNACIRRLLDDVGQLRRCERAIGDDQFLDDRAAGFATVDDGLQRIDAADYLGAVDAELVV